MRLNEGRQGSLENKNRKGPETPIKHEDMSLNSANITPYSERPTNPNTDAKELNYEQDISQDISSFACDILPT